MLGCIDMEYRCKTRTTGCKEEDEEELIASEGVGSEPGTFCGRYGAHDLLDVAAAMFSLGM